MLRDMLQIVCEQKAKAKTKFRGAKVGKAEQVTKYFLNHKSENEIFSQYVNYIICSLDLRNKEAAIRRCTSEQVFLKISQRSQENTCAGVSF